jgi:thiol-disulfide isomerase/thioredoxin
MSALLQAIRKWRTCIAATVLLFGCVWTFAVTAQKPAVVTTAAPKAQAINADELKSLLKRNRGNPLLVNYWATWCEPCREEFPELVKLDSDYRGKGLDFIAITLDDAKDINTEVPKFLREMNARMPVYLLDVVDPEPTINFIDPKWGGALPATFLYDNKGAVVYKHFGRVDVKELREAVEQAIKK